MLNYHEVVQNPFSPGFAPMHQSCGLFLDGKFLSRKKDEHWCNKHVTQEQMWVISRKPTGFL